MPVITQQDQQQESFRRDCLARWMLAKLKRHQIENWLATHPQAAEDMKRRLNEQKALQKQSEAA